MSIGYFRLFLLLFFLWQTAVAKPMIDCRVVTGVFTECKPYGEKFLRAKKIDYDEGRQALIRVKTLPVPEKKQSTRVISIEDMIEKYVKIEAPIRFAGDQDKKVKFTAIKVPTQVEESTIESKISPLIEKDILEKVVREAPKEVETEYIVRKGDMLSRLANKFELDIKVLAHYNGLKTNANLRVGQKLKVPLEQKVVEAYSSGNYRVHEGDTLVSIAKMFHLKPKALIKFNNIKSYADIAPGKTVKLPLSHILAKKEAKKKAKTKKKKRIARRKNGRLDMVHGFGKRKLRVTATAYSSHRAQTDNTPFLAAWNNRIRPGMKIIAVSRDLLTRYGMRNGTKVRIGGLPGYYRVRDKMNKRYRKRIDIYMGMDRRRALRWGRRSVVIYW
ncbi:MAG: LysM peptidoglycan-binding domain-containing protein [Campylobacterota bacterium]|nr:LysM peptidoglycan-binding domain-containing protein [Campylobacterota bacterium]